MIFSSRICHKLSVISSPTILIVTSILYTGLLGTSSPTNGDSGNTPRAAGHPEWSLPFWVGLTPTRTLYRCAGPPISAARLALPARSALPHLFLVSFGPPSKFPGDHWVTSDQNAPKCRHTSRGRLWSVSLTGGVSSHITKAGSRWDEEPLIRLGLMRPLILGHVGALRSSAHLRLWRQELGQRTRAATQFALGCACLMPEHRHVHETWGAFLAFAVTYEQPQNCILRRSA